MDKTRPKTASTPQLPGAVLFDAYGTLFDVYSVGLLAEQLFPGHGQALGLLWRDKQIDYTRLVTSSRSGPERASVYQPFWELTGAALRYACQKLGLDLSAGQEQQLMNQYRHLSAFPENREVLQALKNRGITTGILSNGDPDMLGVAVRSAGLEAMRKAGYGDVLTVAVPHSVGLQHTDEPFRDGLPFAVKDDLVLEENMTLTVDFPHIEVGFGACHLEDLVRVTRDGAEPLAAMDDPLIVL